MEERRERRVVVTGYGALCCLGKSVEEIWTNLVAGKCGIGPVTLFDPATFKTRIGGEVKDFDPVRYIPEKESRHLDRFVQLAIAAAEEAVSMANLKELPPDENPYRIGSLVSSGVGGLKEITDAARTLIERGPSRLSPFLVPKMISDMASGQISIRYGFKGPNFGLVSACASGCHSIGEAFHIVKRDDADVMLAGGTEASIQELCLGGFNALKALSTRNDDPQHASRPFDKDRDGFVPAEGAGVVVLEELEHAKKRGAKILCEIIGYGATGDGFHITSPDPEGNGDAEAFRVAMRHAGIRPDEVDYINAHGTSTALNDKYETIAIRKAFGPDADKISISSTKGATGHALGAAGALESIFCMKAIETGIVPPTINYETPDPDCDLDVTPNQARRRDIRIAANNNLGFGGHNAVVLFRKFEE
ncbi:MAG: beta-ketoacyl-ACP synthase II [Lentisphaeria bacterium]|nr:beta-ketoacyl-ACP synthase II [Lentisphaeria bacterium]